MDEEYIWAVDWALEEASVDHLSREGWEPFGASSISSKGRIPTICYRKLMTLAEFETWTSNLPKDNDD